MPVKTIYVAVDETGNLGRSMKGERYYTLAASVVNDRDRFEFATKRYGLKEEIKFNTHPHLRYEILDYASPTVSEVFYVRYHKDRSNKEPLGEYQKAKKHLDMVQALADAIILRYGLENDLRIEVDQKDGISERKVREIFEKNEYRLKSVDCDVAISSKSYGLQTNDFFVGSIGQMLNYNNTDYVKHFESLLRKSYVRNKNVKNQGEPASTMWNTGHTDSSFRNSPPGIAVEVRGYCAGWPTVRLTDISGSVYLKESAKSGIFERIGRNASIFNRRKHV